MSGRVGNHGKDEVVPGQTCQVFGGMEWGDEHANPEDLSDPDLTGLNSIPSTSVL
jgi:hypothetical protein